MKLKELLTSVLILLISAICINGLLNNSFIQERILAEQIIDNNVILAGGTGSKIATKEVTRGELYGELPTPTWQCHIFDGWYTEQTGGSKITALSVVESNIGRLYAHWKVSHISKGADGQVDSTKVTCESISTAIHAYKCSGCGDVVKEEVHTLGEELAATCTEPCRKICTGCSEVSAISPALGHEFGTEYEIDQEPTCAIEGSKSRKCTRCSAKTGIVSIPTLAHSFSSSYTIDVVATCTSAGSKSKHCTKCDAKTDVVTIPITHQWKTTKSATCTGTGVQTCELCGATSTIAAAGHNWSGANCTKCSETRYSECSCCGENSYTCPCRFDCSICWECTYHGASICYYSIYCTNCCTCENCTSGSSGSSHSHQWVVTVQPSCTVQGKDECSICGMTTNLGYSHPGVTWTYTHYGGGYHTGTSTCTSCGAITGSGNLFPCSPQPGTCTGCGTVFL